MLLATVDRVRTCLRRDDTAVRSAAAAPRLSLDGRNVTSRFGMGDALRVQRLRFDSIADARSAYFARLDELATKGYLDATQE